MDDDLDALLDSALDTMTEQDSAMEKERAAQEAAAQTLLNEALSNAATGGAAGGPLGGMDAEMLTALGGLMAILQKGPDAMENASDDEMAAITGQLQSTLDKLKQHPDLKEEDASQLNEMKKAMEQLNALEKGQGAEGASGESALSEEEFNSRREELTAMLQKMSAPGGLMGGAGGGGPNLPPFPFGGFGAEEKSSTAAAAVAAANALGVPVPPFAGAPAANESASGLSEEEACRQVFELTLGILQEKEIEQPFAKLKAAYGPWLEANAEGLATEERERYENQYRVASEMCDFFSREKISEVLREGSSATTEQRAAALERFGTLMAELHSYGEVPPNLFPEANDAAAEDQNRCE